MNIQLTPGQSQLAAVALLLACIAVLCGAIAFPAWWLHQHYDLAIEDGADRLQRFRSVAALRPAIDAAIDEVETKNARRFYLHAATPTLAAAELQRLATQIIEGQNGRVAATQVLPIKEETKAGTATRVSVTVHFNASAVPLQLILHALETTEPYFFLDQITVRASQGRAYKPVPGIQPEFAVQLTVSAYALPEEDKP